MLVCGSLSNTTNDNSVEKSFLGFNNENKYQYCKY